MNFGLNLKHLLLTPGQNSSVRHHHLALHGHRHPHPGDRICPRDLRRQVQQQAGHCPGETSDSLDV